MTLKDERLKVMNQVLSGIKVRVNCFHVFHSTHQRLVSSAWFGLFQVLKLYAWEPYFEERLARIRKQETDNLRVFWILVAVSNVLWICTPFTVRFSWIKNITFECTHAHFSTKFLNVVV